MALKINYIKGVMGTDSQQNVTGLLRAWSQGDKMALEELIPVVHRELRRLAHVHMAGERPGKTERTFLPLAPN